MHLWLIFIDPVGLQISLCYFISLPPLSLLLHDLPMLFYVFGWVSQETDSELEVSVKEFTGNVLRTGSTPGRGEGQSAEQTSWGDLELGWHH